MYDELFGELKYDHAFIGSTTLNLFEKKWLVSLEIEAEKSEGIKDTQREVYLDFLKNQDTILKEVEDKVYKYYQSIYKDYRLKVESELEKDKVAPVITNKKELLPLIEVTTIIIGLEEEKKLPQLGVMIETTWDPLEGVGVLIENNKVIEVGQIDILF